MTDSQTVARDQADTIIVDHPTVACDGDGGALGHPRVYLNLTTSGEIECPYCGRRYVLDPHAKVGAGH